MSDRLSDTQNIVEGKPQLFVTVRVKLSGFLSRMVPESKFEVEVNPGSTVADLIGLLTGRLGDDFRKAIVDREGRLHGGIMVVLNRRLIPPRQIAEIAMNHKSDLSIIPAANGG